MSDNIETLNAIKTAFEEFKSSNDQRLAEIEAKGAADVVLSEKVDRINQAITDLQKKSGRPAISDADQHEVEAKAAYDSFVRTGTEVKALTTGAESGGVAMPKLIASGLYTALTNVSPIRSLASVVTISGNDYRMLVNKSGTGAGWVGETAARPQTAAPTISEITVPMGEVYANVFASQRSLDDLNFPVEATLNADIALSFAAMEGQAFVNGDGNNQPKGFLNDLTDVTTIATGAAAALPTGADWVFNMIYSMSAVYRSGAGFLANSASVAKVRTYKDKQDGYLWQPGLAAGQPATLGGYPIYEEENMPVIAAGAAPIVFANLAQGYVIADRQEVSVLRDPYSNKPYVSFYATKRVGGVARDKKAFVVLKVGA